MALDKRAWRCQKEHSAQEKGHGAQEKGHGAQEKGHGTAPCYFALDLTLGLQYIIMWTYVIF